MILVHQKVIDYKETTQRGHFVTLEMNILIIEINSLTSVQNIEGVQSSGVLYTREFTQDLYHMAMFSDIRKTAEHTKPES